MKNSNGSFIHLFSVGTKKFFFDVNTDKILQIPTEVYQYLENYLSSGDLTENEEIMKYLKQLKRKGFLKTTRVQVSEHPETNTWINVR